MLAQRWGDVPPPGLGTARRQRVDFGSPAALVSGGRRWELPLGKCLLTARIDRTL